MEFYHEFIESGELFSDYKKKAGPSDALSLTDFKQHAEDHASKIMTVNPALQHRISLIRVRDRVGILPAGFRAVIQFGYSPRLDIKHREILRNRVDDFYKEYGVEFMKRLGCPYCDYPECEHTKDLGVVSFEDLLETSRAMNNPGVYESYQRSLYGSDLIDQCGFQPMTHKSHSFATASYHIQECVNFRYGNPYEYKIDLPQVITNVAEGWVLASYAGIKVAGDGYTMFANNPYVTDAIITGVLMDVANSAYSEKRDAESRRYYESRHSEYINKMRLAKSKMKIESTDRWKAFLDHHWNKVIPYRSWFKNFNAVVPDQYSHPKGVYNLI